ncbi:MAG: helix-turn-helix transcriptional regulator [Bacteroidaceae bacterium]|nr:helix-turn-helix transcriptional regulator [Bacteroidaceae bacterium]
MVRALRQYGRWLRDNFADLEHKEVWQSFVVLAIIMLVFAIYVFTSEGPVYQYAMQMIVLVLVCYLLWRVETLSDLNTKSTLEVSSVPLSRADDLRIDDLRCDSDDCELSAIHTDTALLSFRNNIGPLLKQYCEEPQLYLQYDISLSQLATLIGINRSYLSSHFASQGITYNAYINGLRIQHFINLYHETATTHQPITAQQLAYQSGFRSYSTFSAAFKQVMGMTATEWMRLSES